MKLREVSIGIYYEPYVYGIDENKYASEEEYLNDCREYYRANIFSIQKQFRMETKNISSFLAGCFMKIIKMLNILSVNWS